MSPPDSPTLVKRNANLACGVQIRKSAAIATTLPAPAAMPWMPAMIGIGHSRVAGHLREAHQALGVHPDQLADDLVDVASAAEPLALAADHQHAGVTAVRQLGEQVAEVGVGLEGERVELLGPVEGHRRDAVGDGEVEVLPVVGDAGTRAVTRHVVPLISPRAMIVRCTSEAPS